MTDTPGSPTDHDRMVTRRYLFEAVPAVILMVAPILLLTGQGPEQFENPMRTLLAWAPLVPAAWLASAVWRHVRRVDEYQRRGLYIAFGFGFLAAMLAALSLGLAELAGARVEASEWLVLGAGLLAWFIAGIVTTRR